MHAHGKVCEVAVGDALAEGDVFQRRHGCVVVVQEGLAFLERGRFIGGGVKPGLTAQQVAAGGQLAHLGVDAHAVDGHVGQGLVPALFQIDLGAQAQGIGLGPGIHGGVGHGVPAPEVAVDQHQLTFAKLSAIQDGIAHGVLVGAAVGHGAQLLAQGGQGSGHRLGGQTGSAQDAGLDAQFALGRQQGLHAGVAAILGHTTNHMAGQAGGFFFIGGTFAIGQGQHNPFPFPSTEAAAPETVQLDVLHALTDPTQDKRRKARALYWMGWRVTHIAEHIDVPRTTVHEWKQADGWDKAKAVERVEGTLEMRLCTLINKENKTGGDFKEIDLLGRQMERLARVHKYGETGKESDLNPSINARNAGPKRQPDRSNQLGGEEGLEKLKTAFIDSLFQYQLTWWRNSQERTRAILKSRQIGATWYFAREALIDALEAGRNQIFLSASKAQAHIFRGYILAFVKEVLGIELKGDLQRFGFMPKWNEVHTFRRGSICHIMDPDVDQEVYGVPQYLASLQSSLLNESATLFRRRYYTNGSHAGFILYMTDPSPNQADVDSLRAALKSSKGIGNFRNLFFHSPKGEKDGIKLIPIGEAMAKDEFLNIKNVSRDDQLAAHRVPPELIGVVPGNAAGFGNVVNAARVFARNEIQPLQTHLAAAINDFAGDEICRFDTYRLPGVDEPQAQELK